ncbi:hypothetical protein BCR34DRAFT_646514, partial [Clohesyomyces aquaticus]
WAEASVLSALLILLNTEAAYALALLSCINPDNICWIWLSMLIPISTSSFIPSIVRVFHPTIFLVVEFLSILLSLFLITGICVGTSYLLIRKYRSCREAHNGSQSFAERFLPIVIVFGSLVPPLGTFIGAVYTGVVYNVRHEHRAEPDVILVVLLVSSVLNIRLAPTPAIYTRIRNKSRLHHTNNNWFSQSTQYSHSNVSDRSDVGLQEIRCTSEEDGAWYKELSETIRV